jgi:hypothetical protein
MQIDEEALTRVYASWEPCSGRAADESVVCFGDIGPLVALADDNGVLPVHLAAHDVGMDRIVLMWSVSHELWLQLWDGELAELTTVADGVGVAAVHRLFETIAELAERECRRIGRAPQFVAVRQAQAALETAKDGDSNDAVEDAGDALSDEVTSLLTLFGA